MSHQTTSSSPLKSRLGLCSLIAILYLGQTSELHSFCYLPEIMSIAATPEVDLNKGWKRGPGNFAFAISDTDDDDDSETGDGEVEQGNRAGGGKIYEMTLMQEASQIKTFWPLSHRV
jgi:hypothetical protein